jgi:chaperonin cofactor prefoldin
MSKKESIKDLQERVQFLENEYIELVRRYATLEQKVDDLINNLPD